MERRESIDDAALRVCRAYEKSAARPLCVFPADFLGLTEGPYALPYPPTAQWKTIPAYVDLFDVTKGGMVIAPLYWQTEYIFAKTLRALGTPSSVMHGGNIPVAREIIKQAELEMLFIDEASLDPVYDDLKENHALGHIKIIVGFAPLTHKVDSIGTSFDVLLLRERHIIPGCPILYQRPAEAGTTHFRIHEDFTVDITEDGTYATAVSPDAFPLHHTRLPIMLRPVPDGIDLFEIL